MEPQQIILVLYLVILLILSFKNPRWALLFFFSTKFTIDIFWDYSVVDGLNILKITGVLFPLFCGIYIFIKRPAVFEHPFLKPLLALFVLNCLASLWGILNSRFLFLPQPHSPLTLIHILDWNLRFLNLSFAVLVVPLVLNESKDMIVFLRAFLISTIVPSFISLYQLSSTSIKLVLANVSEPYSAALFHRLNAMYHDSGTLSIAMFTGIVLSIILFSTDTAKPLRVMYLSYSIVCATILYFTFSRTMWICLTMFLSLFFIIQKKYLLFFTVIVAAFLIFTLVPLTQKRFERELHWIENTDKITHSNELERLGAGRMWLWNDARKHFLNLDKLSKAIGSGGSFGSHNQYIAWLLRNGILGLAVWLFFLYKMGYFLGLKLSENSTELTFIFVCALFWVVVGIMNVFMHPWDNTTFSYFFWSSLGLVIFNSKDRSKDQ